MTANSDTPIQVIDEDPARVAESLRAILADNYLLTLATVSPSGTPHINTCYFAEQGLTDLLILTPPDSRHAAYGRAAESCAVNIVDTRHRVGDPITGVQLLCSFSEVPALAAEDAYASYASKHKRFREFAPDGAYVYEHFSSRFFKLRLRSGKLIDEPSFGSERYLSFEVLTG